MDPAPVPANVRFAPKATVALQCSEQHGSATAVRVSRAASPMPNGIV
jgi:hypothetical protein